MVWIVAIPPHFTIACSHNMHMKGFTLIELMVVIAILTLTGTLVFVEFFNARDIANVEISAGKVESMLAQAQSYGRGGRAFSTSTTPVDIENDTARFDRGYGVYLETGTSTVVFYGGQGDAATDVTENRYTAQNAVEVLQLDQAVVQGLCVKVDGTSAGCDETPDELHVLFRRGDVGVAIMKGSGTDMYAFASATVEAGGHTKDVVVWNTGLVYTE